MDSHRSAYFSEIPFVSTAWLAERLGDPALAIIDGSWHLPPTGRNGAAEFASAHIPGAVHVDLDLWADPGSSLPHMLPSEALFAELAGKAAGLKNSRVQIVLVNDSSFNAFVDGSRIFVNTGALTAAAVPNEIIGVIAHEAGHLAGGSVLSWR